MRSFNDSFNPLSVGARSSPLSKAQVDEVLIELRKYHPTVQFEITYFCTTGDQDQVTSLRSLDKTDFFTKEIDLTLLEGKCRLGIHSAKDLPEPIPQGLSVICLTRGINSADVLVMKEGYTLNTLPGRAKIATSSIRREEAVKKLRPDLSFCDLRGTIGQRLELLNAGKVDGIVVAEAALIRLKLTHLNRIFLPGPTSPGQGQLAIVARNSDEEMEALFACMDFRKLL